MYGKVNDGRQLLFNQLSINVTLRKFGFSSLYIFKEIRPKYFYSERKIKGNKSGNYLYALI